ncbi:MAG: ATP-binding protein [Firmicutes bacterium]|nr:ATP-binding protein [Bacillota bacterium]
MKTKQDSSLPLIPSSIRNSLRFKLLTFVMLSMLVLGIGSIGFIYYHEENINNERVEKSFSLIADILKNDTSRWVAERINQVKTISVDPQVIRAVHEISTGSEKTATTERELVNYWNQMAQQYGIYDEIYFASRSGEILVSTDATRKNTIRPRDEIITKPLETGEIYIENAYLSYKTKKPSIAFSVPIKESNNGIGDNHYLGVLVFRVDISAVIKPMLESRMKLGQTGEVILIKQDRTTITGLRERPGSELNYKLETIPAKRISRGEEGSFFGEGHNEKPMIAVYRYVPEVQWGIIVRQETSEIYEPLQKRLYQLIALLSLAGIIVLTILFIFINRAIRPLSMMADAAKHIAQGDFDKKIVVHNDDEIGQLGTVLNKMADELGQRFKLRNSRHHVLQALVSTIEIDDLLNRGLQTICHSFDFKVGAIYLAEHQEGILLRKALYCPGEALFNKREKINLTEGLEGLAVTSRQVQVLSEIPENTFYTVNWLGGNILPRTLIQIPILFGQEVLGVISLASLTDLSSEEVEELGIIGTLVGVAINNALSYQKANDLTISLQEKNEQLNQQNEELNAQSEELQAQTEELRVQSEELQSQSEELQATTEELQLINNELQEQSIRKTKFFASLSHELRAPLNAVIGFSDVLLDSVVGTVNSAQEKYLKEIHNSGQHLLNLINDLLDFSKIEAGQVSLNIKEVDPALALNEAIAMVIPEIAKKELTFNNLLKQDKYLVLSDNNRLIQIYLNLLTNSVKFTPTGGTITLGARPVKDNLEIWISDTGIGIATEFHEVIFEEFKQAPNTTQGGTGLGLAITKRLLGLMGGKIKVEGEVDKGTTFTFTLPLASLKKSTHGESQKRDIKVSKQETDKSGGILVSNLSKPLNKDTLIKLVEEFIKKSGNKPTVLVVDDELSVREYAASLLQSRCQFFTAEDGYKGIELALKYIPDIIILDITMPGADGFAVMGELRKHCWEKGLNVYICSSKNLSIEERKYLQLFEGIWY